MKKANLKINILLQSAYQVLTIIVPFITTPYISRVMNASDLGLFSYSSSIVNYFLMFAYLGIDNLGCRAIAQARANSNDKKRLQDTFWEIRSIQKATNCFAILVYCVFCKLFIKEQTFIFWVQIIAMLSGYFDITWFFFGVENFLLTVTRNAIIKIVSVVLIFICVKGPEDLITYIVIVLLSTFCAKIVLWFFLFKEIKYSPKIINLELLKKYMPENLLLFIPVMATSVYHTMDKTMLGLLSDLTNSGYYYSSEKIVAVPLSLITGLGVVIMPRIASQYGSGNKAASERLLEQSFEVNCFLSLSMSFGIAAIANDFVPLFLGYKYITCVPIVKLFAPIIVIKAFSSYIQTQYLIPSKKESIYIKATVAGAIVNLVANMLLIPKFGASGAVIGTLFAEITSLIVEIFLIRNELRIIYFIYNNILYLFSAIIMFFVVRCFSSVLIETLAVKVLLEIVIGVLMFFLLSLLRWNNKKSVFNSLALKVVDIWK